MVLMTMMNREGIEGFVGQADRHHSWHICMTQNLLVFDLKARFPQNIFALILQLTIELVLVLSDFVKP